MQASLTHNYFKYKVFVGFFLLKISICVLLFPTWSSVLALISAAPRIMVGQFEQWFPHSGRQRLDAIMRENCSFALDNYHALGTQLSCRSVYDCIIGASSETNVATYQAANVLLGLAPTTLSLFGIQTDEIALLFSARPFLSFLLMLGAPTVAPFNAIKYSNPLKALTARTDESYGPKYPEFNSTPKYLLSIIQYLVAAGAAWNVAYLAYELSTKSTFVPSCYATFHPYLWTYTTFAVQISGIMAFAARVRITRAEKPRSNLYGWLHNELRICVSHRDVTYNLQRAGPLYILLHWFTYILVIIHFVYGTLLLSSSSLINTNDAAFIIIRYIISTALCRIIIMLELSGLRKAVDDDNSQGGTTATVRLKSRKHSGIAVLKQASSPHKLAHAPA